MTRPSDVGEPAVGAPYRLLPDPRSAANWWPERPADPRHRLAWAIGSRRSAAEHFLGSGNGPALWVRPPQRQAGPARMDAVAVCAGKPAGILGDPALEQAARAACRRQLVLAANGYCSPVISREATPHRAALRDLVRAALDLAESAGAVPAALSCPADDPLLDVLAEHGFVRGYTDLYAVAEPIGERLEDFAAAQSRSRRITIMRESNALTEHGHGAVLVGEAAEPRIPEAAGLVAEAYAQRGQSIGAAEVESVYRELLAGHGDDFVLFLAEHEGAAVASTCALRGGDALLCYSAGLRQPGARSVAGYFNCGYYLPLRYAYRNGVRRVLLGPGNRETKRLRGARFTLLVSAVPGDQAPLVALLRETDRLTRIELAGYEERFHPRKARER